jgi:hypothetical protein
MSWCEYRYEKRRRVPEKKPRRIGIERYIAKVEVGGGSRSFKEWLLSKPLDAFVVKKIILKEIAA